VAVFLDERLLRMNGMDRYFIAQERPRAPINTHHFVETTAPFDVEALRRAVATFTVENPIARSFVRESFFGVERFVAPRAFGEPLRILEGMVRPTHLDEPFRLGRQPPFRVILAPRDEGWTLVFTLHHSAGDGVAGFHLLGRLLARYDEEVAGRTPAPLAAPDPEHRYRDFLFPNGLLWVLRMIRRHVRPLDKVGVLNASLVDSEKPRRQEATRDLMIETKARWNDDLLTAALRAALSWRRARALPERPFRVLFPIDLRPLLGLPVCVQNWVGVVRADFTPEEIESKDLPTKIRERVREAKTLEDGLETPVNLGFLSALLPPFVFRDALKRFDLDPDSFFFSFVWSHLKVPDLTLPAGTERVWFRSSLLRQPGTGFFLSTRDDRTRVALTWLEPFASEASMVDMGSRFEGQLS
ncbi:MAG TPA: hypothetical protein VFF73_11575, partial [Planctomycetota bacterium]|nr:hypothetical protein [Planctomycetota bacterium]